MRAQLRTYHAIPSLQARQDPHAYKQLQDAPRLKSILKGGAEDREEPSTLDKIKFLDVPRTNPVNLIFVMCNAAQKIAELHFPQDHEFHDLVMKTHYTSKSRATAFLWLMWFYLESDFTEEGCEENPFGPGVDYGLDVANQGVPKLVKLTDEQKAKENIDTEEEIEFGRQKQKTRAKILEMDNAYLHERENKRGKVRPPVVDDGPAILPRIRPSKHDSDIDSTRSTPPPKALNRPAANSSRRGAPLKYQIFEGSSPAHQAPEGVVARKPRPPTAHQLAVERNRSQRVDYILDRGLRKTHRRNKRARKQDGAIFRAYKRCQVDPSPLEDSDEDGPEAIEANKGSVFREKGLHGLSSLASEPDDYGEEVSAYSAALRRTQRRLERWYDKRDELGVIAPVRRRKIEEPVLKGTKKERRNAKRARLQSATNGDDTQGDVTMGDITMGETTLGDMTLGDVTLGDITLGDGDGDGDGEDVDQTLLLDEEERMDGDMDDPDKTEVMDDSDME